MIPREGVESDYADVVRVREGVIPREGVESKGVRILYLHPYLIDDAVIPREGVESTHRWRKSSADSISRDPERGS